MSDAANLAGGDALMARALEGDQEAMAALMAQAHEAERGPALASTTPAPAPVLLTREAAVDALRRAADELGHPPTTGWWATQGRKPNYRSIVRLCGGSWSTALA